jgi:hypothetical protein
VAIAVLHPEAGGRVGIPAQTGTYLQVWHRVEAPPEALAVVAAPPAPNGPMVPSSAPIPSKNLAA